jgi:hypothetical protein
MGTNVKLSDDFVAMARALAKRDHRSLPKQIEFYFRVARAAEENPDLPFKFVLELMNSLEDSTRIPYTGQLVDLLPASSGRVDQRDVELPKNDQKTKSESI